MRRQASQAVGVSGKDAGDGRESNGTRGAYRNRYLLHWCVRRKRKVCAPLICWKPCCGRRCSTAVWCTSLKRLIDWLSFHARHSQRQRCKQKSTTLVPNGV